MLNIPILTKRINYIKLLGYIGFTELIQMNKKSKAACTIVSELII